MMESCADPSSLSGLAWFACYLTTGKHMAFYLSFGTVLLLLAIPWPWGVMRDGVRELLLIGPPEAIRRQVIEQVDDVMSSLKPRDVICRVLLSHDQLYVMCHVLVEGDAVISVSEIDRVRQTAMDRLGEHHSVSEFDLIITGNDEYGRLVD